MKHNKIIDYYECVNDKYVMCCEKMVQKYNKLDKTQKIIFNNKMKIVNTLRLFKEEMCLNGITDLHGNICDEHKEHFFEFDVGMKNVSDVEYAKYENKCRLAKILYHKICNGRPVKFLSVSDDYVDRETYRSIDFKVTINAIIGFFKMPKLKL